MGAGQCMGKDCGNTSGVTIRDEANVASENASAEEVMTGHVKEAQLAKEKEQREAEDAAKLQVEKEREKAFEEDENKRRAEAQESQEQAERMKKEASEAQSAAEAALRAQEENAKAQEESDRRKRRESWEAAMETTRTEKMGKGEVMGPSDAKDRNNRYGLNSTMPAFEASRHIPVLALINPMSGAKAGRDILDVARRTPYYRDRFFNIIQVIKGQSRGGLMDVFRVELLKAVEEARRQGKRCRIISAGGDGTASFAMFVVFKTLQARANEAGREDDGLADTGNGFIWTDAQFEECFPALAQMPLGSANDCANILGWGQIYPGDGLCKSQGSRASTLQSWIASAISPNSQVVNFDVWGIMPQPPEDTTNFKICELTGDAGISPRVKKDGRWQLSMKTTGNPVPFFVCLYFSVGFFGYVVARFQLNRHGTPARNTMEYIRQGASVLLFERTPPQMKRQLDGIQIDAGGEPYFPPRRQKGTKARNYTECGFYNINWQAHKFHGADRAPLCSRLCCGKREPVKFSDGLMDLQRQKILTLAKNPGFRMQTDKRKDFHLKFDGGKGKGFFFQYDGEARFAFTPDGSPFDIYIRQVLNLPVVIGPWHSAKLTGPLTASNKFEFHGDTPAEKEQVKRRLFKNLDGALETEMCATEAELRQADLINTD